MRQCLIEAVFQSSVGSYARLVPNLSENVHFWNLFPCILHSFIGIPVKDFKYSDQTKFCRKTFWKHSVQSSSKRAVKQKDAIFPFFKQQPIHLSAYIGTIFLSNQCSSWKTAAFSFHHHNFYRFAFSSTSSTKFLFIVIKLKFPFFLKKNACPLLLP